MGHNIIHENKTFVEWDYKIGDKVGVKNMEFSANQKVCMVVILGLSQQFIHMEQLGFNTEQNLND